VEIGAGLLRIGYPENDRFRSVFIFSRLQVLGDRIEGFVPGDTLPFVAAPRAGAFQGILEAVGMIDKVQLGFPAGTVRRRRVGDIDFYGFPVPDMDFRGTSRGAHVAEAVFDFRRFCHFLIAFWYFS